VSTQLLRQTRNLEKLAWSLSCLLVLSSAGSLVALRASATESTRLTSTELNLLKALDKRDFLLEATCRDVSNTILQQSHLPLIGEKTAKLTHGKRGNFDRSHDSSELPTFKDTIKTDYNAHPMEILVDGAGAQDEKSWELSLKRTAEDKSNPFTLRTRFLFGVTHGPNGSICGLKNIEFTSEDKRSPAERITNDGLSCLRKFSARIIPITRDQRKRALQGFMNKDCAVGLAFFDDVKMQLSNKKLR
jgi:hypothetical protein